MGNLREQLLKAKLIDENQARNVKREQRQKRRQKGMQTLQKEQREKEAAFRREQLEQAARDRDRAQTELQQLSKSSTAARLIQQIESGEIHTERRGGIPFYFVTRTGRIPCLEISSAMAEALRSGAAAIVEKPSTHGETYTLVNRETAILLMEKAPERVLYFEQT